MIVERPYKVAIVDDSTAMQRFIGEVVGRDPAFVASAFSDGNEAMEAIERDDIRVVFVDINMPSMFGDDLLRSCVALRRGIQVYVITGAGSLTIVSRCMNIGARGVIPKQMLQEGCAQALADSQRFFDQWNSTMRYFITHRKTA